MTLQELKMKKETLEMQVKSIKQEIADTEKQIEELKKPKRWKPSFQEKYFFIDRNNHIYEHFWTGDDIDLCLYSIGNCFKTIEEAKFALEQLKVLAELKEYADDDLDWSERHYSIVYDAMLNSVAYNYWSRSYKCIPFNIYFSSEEKARKAVEAIGVNRLKKYYFCV